MNAPHPHLHPRRRATPPAPRLSRLRASAPGFTLVEVLIALTLLSLLMLTLGGALRAMGQSDERVEQRVAQADDYRVATRLLQGVLARISARRDAPPPDAARGPARPFFEAAPDALAWIGVLPARFGAGGRQYFRLALENLAAGGTGVVLRFAPWDGTPGFADWDRAEALVIAAPATALALRYRNAETGEWLPAWPPEGALAGGAGTPNLLPSAVAIQIEGAVPEWPPLVAPTAASRITDPAGSGEAAFGGSEAS